MNWKYKYIVLLIATSSSLAGADDEKVLFIQGDNKNFVEKTKKVDKYYNFSISTNGEEIPVSENKSREGKQLNRRTDILFNNRVILKNNRGSIWTTVDPLNIDTKLSITSEKGNIVRGEKTWFKIYSNYDSFIEKWEITVKDRDTKKVIETIKGNKIDFDKKIEWIPSENLTLNENVVYSIKVFDKFNNFDETAEKTLVVISKEREKKDISLEKKGERDIPGGEIYGKDEKIIKNIQVVGGRVRSFGKGFSKEIELYLDNNKVAIDKNGKFAIENILTSGEQVLNFKIVDNKESFPYPIRVVIPDKYNFYVGLIDVTNGKYKTSGSKEILSKDYHYDSSGYTDGRVAFYSKNKYKKYYLTAQLDTKTEEIGKIFSSMKERDNKEIFRDENRDKYYSTYGDNSTTYSDVNTQGKMYLKLNWDKNSVLWGNYNTGFTGTEFANYNRSLYGAKLDFNSNESTTYGETKNSAKFFISQPGSLFSHDTLIGTGGSLYYLKHTDVLSGSAKVWIELKDENTGVVTENLYLKEGEDYTINYYQGRIILNRPLNEIIKSNNSGIITNGNNLGKIALLNIDYEYTPLKSFDENSVFGLRGSSWINDNVEVGGTYLKGNDTGLDYITKEAEITLRKNDDSYIKGEIAQNNGSESNSKYFSDNGGITFDKIKNSSDKKGMAYSISGKLKLNDNINTEGWYSKKEKGFSTTNLSDSEETNRYGAKVNYLYSNNLLLNASYSLDRNSSYDEINNKEVLKEEYYGVLAKLKLKRLVLTGELKNNKEKTMDSEGNALLGAVKGDYNLTENTDVYTTVQQTLNKTKEYDLNNRVTIGTNTQVSDKLGLNAESSWGNRGDSILAGADYSFGENHDLYVNYLISNERDEQSKTLTFGQKMKLNKKYSIYQENQFVNSESEGHGLVQGYGLDFQASEKLRTGVSYSQGNLKNGEGSTKRKTISTYSSYETVELSLRNRLEYREDIDSEKSLNQWLTTNNLKYIIDNEWTFQGKVNLSLTKDKKSKECDGKFAEITIGFAYRPIWNDRLNLISKYTYLYDLPSVGQDDGENDNLVNEKSQIFSLEEIYSLTKKIDIGSKVAYKEGMLRAGRDVGDWYKNSAELYALKTTYHIVNNWDVLGEYHWLVSNTSHDKKEGCLASVQYHINKNMKVGVGYNFTSFTDDLVSSNYNAKGYFVNIIGKF